MVRIRENAGGGRVRSVGRSVRRICGESCAKEPVWVYTFNRLSSSLVNLIINAHCPSMAASSPAWAIIRIHLSMQACLGSRLGPLGCDEHANIVKCTADVHPARAPRSCTCSAGHGAACIVLHTPCNVSSSYDDNTLPRQKGSPGDANWQQCFTTVLSLTSCRVRERTISWAMMHSTC